MREILFRGKRIDNGEWVFGMPWIFKEKSCICPWKKGMCKYDTGFFPVEVIPKTVGQYTGLKDENGKRIFEGDVVYDRFTKDKVVFEDCQWKLVDRYGKWIELFNREVEVIGNIHDNPELLEVANAER